MRAWVGPGDTLTRTYVIMSWGHEKVMHAKAYQFLVKMEPTSRYIQQEQIKMLSFSILVCILR
jgi:hypothetical protein